MVSGVRSLNDVEAAELDKLNAAVLSALRERKEWLDKKMVEISPLKVGDDIYNLRTYEKVGVVSGMYRYHTREHHGIYDSYASVEYEFKVGDRSFDNTSRSRDAFGSLEMSKRRAEFDYQRAISRLE